MFVSDGIFIYDYTLLDAFLLFTMQIIAIIRAISRIPPNTDITITNGLTVFYKMKLILILIGLGEKFTTVINNFLCWVSAVNFSKLLLVITYRPSVEPLATLKKFATSP